MNANWMMMGAALLAGTVNPPPVPAAPPPGLLEPVAIVQQPPFRVAYVEQIGNFQGNGEIYDVLLQKLLDWAIPANTWDFPAKTLIVCIYPDDPESTPPDQQRLWLGMTLPPGATPPDTLHTLDLPAGPHAVGRFLITADQFGPAWGFMYGEALARLGHAPAGLAFELQKNDSSEHPEQKHLVDICIPVQPITNP